MRNYFITFYLLAFAVLQPAISRPYLKIQQVRSIDYPYIQVEVSLANITPIQDLDSSSFEVFENDWKVNAFQVKKIEPHKNPKNIILLVDSSKSLSIKQFKMQSEAAQNFAKALNANDKIAVLGFNDKVVNHCGFISEQLNMTECIQSVQRKGEKTVLYDALFESLKLAENLKPQRNFIILFTDGRDDGSVMVMDDIMTRLSRINTPIFVVATGNKENLKPISRITRISGGDIYHVNHIENLSKIYLLLNELLDNSYIIRYVSNASSTSLDGKRVKLVARVKTEDFTEEDTYTFFLHSFSLTDWWQKIKSNESYWLFGIGGGVILFFIFILMAVIRRPQLTPPMAEKVSYHEEQEDEAHDVQEYISSGEGGRAALSAKKPERRESKDSEHKKYKGYLVEKEGPNTGRKYELNWDNISIGYADENSVVIDDPMVSYEHAKVRRQNHQFVLYDLLSENGTYLNGKKLLRPLHLKDFDEIKIGKTKLIFRKIIF